MRFCLFLLPAALLLSQTAGDVFRKAPPAVDQALRARILLFYQLHGEGKFRQAEAMVAEDTKEFFYNTNKPRYLNCVIRNIEYSPDFTKAKALVAAEMRVPFPGLTDKPVQIPHISRWKLVDGDWFWYVDQEELKMTPFGKMDSADPKATKGPAPNMSNAPDVNAVLNQIAVDKDSVQLPRTKNAEGKVRIASRMPGKVNLAVTSEVPAGLDVDIDPLQLNGTSTATVTVRLTDPQKAPPESVITVTVQPLGKQIPIRINTVK